MLDKKLSKEDLAQNYEILLKQWDPPITITTVHGVQIEIINIGKALFNEVSITYLVLTIVMFAVAILLGKIVFPQLAKMYTSANDQMADLAAIQTREMVKEKKDKKEWF